MHLFKKFYWLINPILIVCFITLAKEVFKIENTFLSTGVACALAFVLSPKVKIVEKQTGEEEQIKWLFFKKVINKKM
ncbi:hypothetical protein [uncultured Polaribacter sp.]|uniref:hypothetical protein n=1 Tax=uncultured Polaribacter sp. TaxID=174711 RepID=UPI0026313140|nr:hypothetical protein [uncultured Polaribacter sp.]